MTRAQYEDLERRLLVATDRAYALGNLVAQDMGAVLRDTLRAGWPEMSESQGAALVNGYEATVGIRPRAQPTTGQTTTGQTTTGQTTTGQTTTGQTTAMTPATIKSSYFKLTPTIAIGAAAIAAAVYFIATRRK